MKKLSLIIMMMLGGCTVSNPGNQADAWLLGEVSAINDKRAYTALLSVQENQSQEPLKIIFTTDKEMHFDNPCGIAKARYVVQGDLIKADDFEIKKTYNCSFKNQESYIFLKKWLQKGMVMNRQYERMEFSNKVAKLGFKPIR